MTATQERTSTVQSGEDAVGSPLQVSMRDLRRARNLRYLVLLLLVAFLVLGALNVFGGKTAKTQSQASSGDWQLQVSYPRTGRPGLGAPLSIQVQHKGGFDGPVTLSMTSDYLDLLNISQIAPDPSQATQTDKAVTWQFNQPPGDTLGVSFNAEFESAEHPGPHDATVTLLDSNNARITHVRFRTWEAP